MPRRMQSNAKYVAGPRVPFSVVSDQVLRDPGLTYGARGLYAVLCTLPEGTEFTRKEIDTWTADGDFRVRQYLVELADRKFLALQRVHDGRRFVASRYVFCAFGDAEDVPKVLCATDPAGTSGQIVRERLPSHLEPIEQPGYDAPDVLTDGLGPGRQPE